MKTVSIVGSLLVTFLAITTFSWAEDTAEGLAFFEKKIRPLLATHCFECHSAKSKKLEGGLRLDHREGFLKGGASGKPVVLPASKFGQSRLFKLVRLKKGEDSKHPPMAKPLSTIEIRSLATWVQMKLPFPEATGPTVAEKS